MYSKNAPRNIRLPKQSAVPSYEDIEFLMGEANKTTGRMVELPGSPPESKQEFLLTVKYDTRESDPLWVLFQVTDAGQVPVWNYQSRDVPLLANIIFSSSGSDQLQ